MTQRHPYCADRMCGATDCSTCHGHGDDGDGCEDCGADDAERDCSCVSTCGDCGDDVAGEPERDAYGRVSYGQCETCRVQQEARDAGQLYCYPEQLSTTTFYEDDLPW